MMDPAGFSGYLLEWSPALPLQPPGPTMNGYVLPVLLVTSLLGCTPPPVALECDSGVAYCTTQEVLSEERPPATGLDIDGFAVYQGVEQVLMVDSLETTEVTLPMVAQRDAVFRVLVTRHEDWTDDRIVTARLYLYRDGDLVAAFQDDLEVKQDSDWRDLATTFNIRVDGSLLHGDIEYVVKLVEDTPDTVVPGAEGVNVWPTTAHSLSFQDVGEPLRILYIPIQYNADGSGRLPDTSEEQMEAYRDLMWAIFPTPSVEIEIGSEFAYEAQVRATVPNDFAILLSAIADARQSYGATDDVYLYGGFSPAEDINTFCEGGCDLGMSLTAASASDVYNRASIGVGWTGSYAVEQMPHELGHAHGRGHAPGCYGDTLDANYPVTIPDGSLDARGLDMRTMTPIEQDVNYDIMSACSPRWLSAYNFANIAMRIMEVNQLYRGLEVQESRWMSVWSYPDGQLAWGADREIAGVPGGDTRSVDLLDASGQRIKTVQAWFSPFSGLGGGSLTFPDPGVPVAAVRYEGAVTPHRK